MPTSRHPTIARLAHTVLFASTAQRSVICALHPPARTPVAFTPYGFSALADRRLAGFNGQFADALTGCYHLGNGHRVYNPALMRFQRADTLSPFGKGGLNSYAYCAGDPVNFEDPSGQFLQAFAQAIKGLSRALKHVKNVQELFSMPALTLKGIGQASSRSGSALLVTGLLATHSELPIAGRYLTSAGTALLTTGKTLKSADKIIAWIKPLVRGVRPAATANTIRTS